LWAAPWRLILGRNRKITQHSQFKPPGRAYFGNSGLIKKAGRGFPPAICRSPPIRRVFLQYSKFPGSFLSSSVRGQKPNTAWRSRICRTIAFSICAAGTAAVCAATGAPGRAVCSVGGDGGAMVLPGRWSMSSPAATDPTFSFFAMGTCDLIFISSFFCASKSYFSYWHVIHKRKMKRPGKILKLKNKDEIVK
jgi:hypothetical protein